VCSELRDLSKFGEISDNISEMVRDRDIIIIIIIIIITGMIFMVLSSWQSHCESSPGSFDECRLSAEVAANPQTKPTDLDCESAGNGSYHRVCLYVVSFDSCQS